MPIKLLIGDDRFRISQAIAHHKTQLDPASWMLNYHPFEVADFKAAKLKLALPTEIAPVARTFALTGDAQLVVINNITLNGLEIADLQWLEDVPDQTTVLVTTTALDRRTKLSKWLAKLATIQTYELPNPWQLDHIEAIVKQHAQALKVELSPKSLAYLAEALGTDTAKIHSSLQKLKLYAMNNQSQPLQLAEVKRLVPSQTQSVWQLAAAIQDGHTQQVIALVNALHNTHPIALIAPLIAQFRTWLMVKAALAQKLPEAEIADLVKLGNPKRLYYLKQEVAPLKLAALVRSLSQLVKLETALRQGQTQTLMSELVAIATNLVPACGRTHVL